MTVGLGEGGGVAGGPPASPAQRARTLVERTEAGTAAYLALAVEVGALAPLPGAGGTRARWELLATLAAHDLAAARVAEAHLDALAILAEAGESAEPGTTWGVFAAEGPGVRVVATQGPGGWRLTGTKPWASLAGRLDRALVTAHLADGSGRRLFAVDLRHDGVVARPDGWVARGLVDVPSGPVELTDVPATPVGATGWYLERPGFAHGGIGVAACWYGGAVGVARRLQRAADERAPDDAALTHLGRVDRPLHATRLALADAALAVDEGRATGADGMLLSQRVRGVAAACVDTVLGEVGHALGPAPLATEEAHARRVADLTVYVRQHHADRDDAATGRLLVASGGGWW